MAFEIYNIYNIYKSNSFRKIFLMFLFAEHIIVQCDSARCSELFQFCDSPIWTGIHGKPRWGSLIGIFYRDSSQTWTNMLTFNYLFLNKYNHVCSFVCSMISNLHQSKRSGNTDNKVTEVQMDAEHFCHNKKEKLDSTGHADHINDEQPQPRDITIEECSCTSQVDSTSSQMFGSLYNTVKNSSDSYCFAEDSICQQTNTETSTLVMLISWMINSLNHEMRYQHRRALLQ